MPGIPDPLLFFSAVAAAACTVFLLLEGFTVHALAHGGICFVGRNLYRIQCAVVFRAAMVFTLLDSAFNGGVGSLVFHVKVPSFQKFG